MDRETDSNSSTPKLLDYSCCCCYCYCPFPKGKAEALYVAIAKAMTRQAVSTLSLALSKIVSGIESEIWMQCRVNTMDHSVSYWVIRVGWQTKADGNLKLGHCLSNDPCAFISVNENLRQLIGRTMSFEIISSQYKTTNYTVHTYIRYHSQCKVLRTMTTHIVSQHELTRCLDLIDFTQICGASWRFIVHCLMAGRIRKCGLVRKWVLLILGKIEHAPKVDFHFSLI